VTTFARPRRDSGFQFVDFVAREARMDGIESLTAESYTVHSTINARLQRDTELALQEGLAQYEISSGQVAWRGPEANIAEAVQKLAGNNRPEPGNSRPGTPAWQLALKALHLPLYDVHWTPAVVLQKGQSVRVGLADGRTGPLLNLTADIARNLNLYDVVYVHESEANGSRGSVQARLRVRPSVQGAALVLENRTGRILAMAGSFSYPLSQLNHLADRASARLNDQTAYLSYGTAEGVAA
jgi:penicillin-binding protein 1A